MNAAFLDVPVDFRRLELSDLMVPADVLLITIVMYTLLIYTRFLISANVFLALSNLFTPVNIVSLCLYCAIYTARSLSYFSPRVVD